MAGRCRCCDRLDFTAYLGGNYGSAKDGAGEGSPLWRYGRQARKWLGPFAPRHNAGIVHRCRTRQSTAQKSGCYHPEAAENKTYCVCWTVAWTQQSSHAHCSVNATASLHNMYYQRVQDDSCLTSSDCSAVLQTRTDTSHSGINQQQAPHFCSAEIPRSIPPGPRVCTSWTTLSLGTSHQQGDAARQDVPKPSLGQEGHTRGPGGLLLEISAPTSSHLQALSPAVLCRPVKLPGSCIEVRLPKCGIWQSCEALRGRYE